MKKPIIKRSMIFVIVLVILFTMSPTIGLAQKNDIQNHWAKDIIEKWLGLGLATGYQDNSFRPENPITRAEFMALTNRAFGFTDESTIKISDVKDSDWYAKTVKQAISAGYIGGYPDGSIRPDNPIARQEAAVIIKSIMNLTVNAIVTDNFNDGAGIPAWSKGHVGAVVQAGYMRGYPDGSFKPEASITRAEALVVLDKAMMENHDTEDEKTIIDKAGIYGAATGTEIMHGDVVITAEGVTLQNMIIKGDLIIDEKVGNGDVHLKNVVVKGNTFVNGGGENSIYFIDVTLGKVYVLRSDGPVRIVATGTSEIQELIAGSDVKLEEVNLAGGGFEGIVVEKNAAGNINITLVGVKCDTIDIKAEGVKLNVDNTSTVAKLIVDAPNTEITGSGKIDSAVVNVNGVSFQNRPTTITTASGVETPTVINVPIPSGGGGGGGGGGTAPNASQSAPTGLAGVAPTSALNDGKITGTTAAMEYKLLSAENWIAVTGTEITDLAAGTYHVRYAAKEGFNAGATTDVVVPAYVAPNASQSAPTGLAGIAPTSALNYDGKITGTTAEMEYKLSEDQDWTAVTGTEITGLAAGTYHVRYAAKEGFNAGAAADVVVPVYVAPVLTEVNLEVPAEYAMPYHINVIVTNKITEEPVIALEAKDFTIIDWNSDRIHITDPLETHQQDGHYTLYPDQWVRCPVIGWDVRLPVGSYMIEFSRTGYATTSVEFEITWSEVPNQDQSAPTGLAGVAPTSALNDGKITGTTAAMEYKLLSAENWIAVTGTEITDLAAGTYHVRYAAKEGFNAGAAADVVVPVYVAPVIEPGAPASFEFEIRPGSVEFEVSAIKDIEGISVDLDKLFIYPNSLVEFIRTTDQGIVATFNFSYLDIDEDKLQSGLEFEDIYEYWMGLAFIEEFDQIESFRVTLSGTYDGIPFEEIKIEGLQFTDRAGIASYISDSLTDTLQDLLAQANMLKSSAAIGTNPGQAPQTAHDALESAINGANSLQGSGGTIKQLFDAVEMLSIAMTEFEKSIVPAPIPILPSAEYSNAWFIADNEDGTAVIGVNVFDDEHNPIETYIAVDFAVHATGTAEDVGVIEGVQYLHGGTYNLTLSHDDGTYDVDVKVDGILVEENLEVTISTAAPLPAVGDLLHAVAGSDFTGVIYSKAGSIYYNQVDISGIWGNETFLGTGTEGRMAIDSTGKPHAVYTTEGKIGYRMYDGSAWSEEVLIYSQNHGGVGSCSKPDIGVDGDGKAHITYTDSHGSIGDDYTHPDIMYAHNSTGAFTTTVMYRGYRDFSSSGSWAADYYNKGSYITVNQNGDYFILAHNHNIWRWFAGNDNTYSVVVKSNLGEGAKSNYGSDIFDIYDLTSNGNKVIALYKETDFKTSELTVSGATINFTNTQDITGAAVNSVETDGINVVVGGISNTNLQTNYNGTSKVYEGISVKVGTKVSVIHQNGNFYAIYTNNSDSNIKMREVAAPPVLTAVNLSVPAEQAIPYHIDAFVINASTGDPITGLVAEDFTIINSASERINIAMVEPGGFAMEDGHYTLYPDQWVNCPVIGWDVRLPVGTYTLEFSRAGYVTTSVEFEITSEAVIVTESSIANGAENPTVVVSLSGNFFTEDAMIPPSWVIDTGTTGLSAESTIMKNTDYQVTIPLLGTASAGTISIKASAAALSGNADSNTITVIVPEIVPEP